MAKVEIMNKLDVSEWERQEFKIIAPLPPGITVDEMEKLIRGAIMGMYMEQQMFPAMSTQ